MLIQLTERTGNTPRPCFLEARDIRRITNTPEDVAPSPTAPQGVRYPHWVHSVILSSLGANGNFTTLAEESPEDVAVLISLAEATERFAIDGKTKMPMKPPRREDLGPRAPLS